MKYSFVSIILLFILSSSLFSSSFSPLTAYSQSATIRCSKTVVDTVEAMEAIEYRINRLNTICLQDSDESQLLSMPDSFSAEVWWNLYGDSDIPVKEVLATREAVGIDTIPFLDLTAHFYPKKEDRDMFLKQLSISGKFDGLIEDLIGVFPANENLDKIFIKSMDETVTPLWISLGFKADVVLIEKCNSYWENTPRKRDGFEIKIFFPDSTDGVRLFYYFDGKEWRQTLPRNKECLSYDECVEMVRQQGAEPILIKGNWSDYDSDLPSSFLVISDEALYENPNFPGDQNVLKYKIDSGSESLSGNCVIISADMRFPSIFVIRNYEDTGKDVIALEYILDKEGYRLRNREIYIPVRDTSGIMAGPKIKGCNFDRSVYLKKIAEGTLNYQNNKWYMKNITSKDF